MCSWAKPLLKHWSLPSKLWPTVYAAVKEKKKKGRASLTTDYIWEMGFFNPTCLTARHERHLQVRFKSVPLLWFPGSTYFSINWSEREKLMQFVVISVSEEKKNTIRCLLPIFEFNSSFANHLSWEPPQRKKNWEKKHLKRKNCLSKQICRMFYHNAVSIRYLLQWGTAFKHAETSSLPGLSTENWATLDRLGKKCGIRCSPMLLDILVLRVP